MVPLGTSFLGALDANNFWQAIEKMSKHVPLQSPWLAEKAEKWDKMTVKQYIDSKCWTRFANLKQQCFF